MFLRVVVVFFVVVVVLEVLVVVEEPRDEIPVPGVVVDVVVVTIVLV